MYQILRREQFSDTTFLWDVEAPDVARAARPGHFVMVRLDEEGERIPLTVADYDPDRGTVTVVIQALGKSTREMRDHFQAGDTFADFVGPLGQPQHVDKVGHVVLVGGGLGVAPIYPQLRAFKQAGNRTTAIMGFRTKDLVFWEDRFRDWADELIICTDDGSYGTPGLVTAVLADTLRRGPVDLVVAIGPLPMMRAAVETTRPAGIRTMVSLNTIMVDGTGMCGSCRVTVGDKVRFACVDGPDFDGHQVDFAELLQRQKRFHTQESQANEDLDHVCNLERLLVREGKRSYKKLAVLEREQVRMPERNAEERSHNFLEVNLGYSHQDAYREAERCIQCARPTCISGCPVSIDIPGFIRHLLLRDLDGALETIRQSSLFPSICGRVCPQESQCESQCVIARKMAPVAIGRLERFVGDHARARKAQPPANAGQLGRVAIVGSGPGGLAAAADLARAGAAVTVYEALHVLGGVLRYGIPAFRLPRDIIERELAGLSDLGVRFETNKVIGQTFTVRELLDERGFDAVFVAAGAGAPSFLGIPGEFAGQVYSANEFLTRVNLMGGDLFPYVDTPIAVGSSVVVIGAGNTAMDCLRVAKRLGVPQVACVYRRSEAEAPARIEELRHAREEGISFHFLHSPVAIHVDDQGSVRGMRLQKMALGEPDERGRRKPVPLDEFVEMTCDTVIYALGTNANPIVPRATPGLALTKWGYIVADEKTQATSLPGVFAGGDIVTGGATVILAMSAGRRAAKAIAAYLDGGKRTWPITPDAIAQWKERRATAPALPQPALCPRCHQPLADGDESYVCCAGETLQWRCADCGKISEGFAFPYGMCPLCGGPLSAHAPVSPDNPAAVAGIRAAFEIELGGQAFYTHALLHTEDPILGALFGKLAAMESEHMTTLARRYHTPVPPPPAVFRTDLVTAQTGIEGVPDTPETLFRTAIAFEERAAILFADNAAHAPEGSAEQHLYQELAAEEREHGALLATEFARWQAGKEGLL
jgi:glutamate synthase (NADPH) small chain